MAKIRVGEKKLAYILFEGDTEEVFFSSVIRKYVSRSVRRDYKNLGTGSGINKQVVSLVDYFLRSSRKEFDSLYVYVFLDREGPLSHIPEINESAILSKLGSPKVRKVAKIEAVQMIESWFFYDLPGICRYIGLPCSATLQSNYANTMNLDHHDMANLFRKGSKRKHYIKGDKTFLSALNIDDIFRKCVALQEGINMINNDCGC